MVGDDDGAKMESVSPKGLAAWRDRGKALDT
jgi:hypothetical protein